MKKGRHNSWVARFPVTEPNGMYYVLADHHLFTFKVIQHLITYNLSEWELWKKKIEKFLKVSCSLHLLHRVQASSQSLSEDGSTGRPPPRPA